VVWGPRLGMSFSGFLRVETGWTQGVAPAANEDETRRTFVNSFPETLGSDCDAVLSINWAGPARQSCGRSTRPSGSGSLPSPRNRRPPSILTPGASGLRLKSVKSAHTLHERLASQMSLTSHLTPAYSSKGSTLQLVTASTHQLCYGWE